jgi:hypothetical protein
MILQILKGGHFLAISHMFGTRGIIKYANYQYTQLRSQKGSPRLISATPYNYRPEHD